MGRAAEEVAENGKDPCSFCQHPSLCLRLSLVRQCCCVKSKRFPSLEVCLLLQTPCVLCDIPDLQMTYRGWSCSHCRVLAHACAWTRLVLGTSCLSSQPWWVTQLSTLRSILVALGIHQYVSISLHGKEREKSD